MNFTGWREVRGTGYSWAGVLHPRDALIKGVFCHPPRHARGLSQAWGAAGPLPAAPAQPTSQAAEFTPPPALCRRQRTGSGKGGTLPSHPGEGAAALKRPGDGATARSVPPCPEMEVSQAGDGRWWLIPITGSRRGSKEREGGAAQWGRAGGQAAAHPEPPRPPRCEDNTGQVSSAAGADGRLTPRCCRRLPAACLRSRQDEEEEDLKPGHPGSTLLSRLVRKEGGTGSYSPRTVSP